MRYTTILLISLFSALMLVACATNPTGEVVKETTKEPIQIGLIAPITLSFGEPQMKAVVAGVEKINDEGGIDGRQIQLIIEDGACDGKTATAAAHKLVESDGVSIVLGGGCSTESLAIAPYLNERRVLQIAAVTSSDDYTDAGPYSFRTMATVRDTASTVADYALVNHVERVAILQEQREWPVSFTRSFKNRFEEHGGIIVQEQFFSPEERDFRSYVTALDGDADTVFFAAQTEEQVALFYRALRELGMLDQFKIYGTSSIATQTAFTLTDGMIAGAYTADFYVNPERSATKEMIETYRQRWGVDPETNLGWVAGSYDRLFLVAEAIEHCGTERDTDCLREYLHSVKEWEGAYGTISFDENGDVTSPVAIHYFDADGTEHWESMEE